MLANPIKYRTCDVSWNGESTKLRSYRRDHITKALRRGQFYEHDFLSFIAERYSAPGLFVDVGAFVGNHAIFFAKHCRAGHVIAFEPFPTTFALMKYNVRLNALSGSITCVNKAVSDQPGELKMSVVNKKNRGMNRIDQSGKTPVEVSTLDQELSDTIPISFLKIDAEGHGANVLRGARNLITLHRPTIAVELEPDTNGDADAPDASDAANDPVANLMEEFGYVVRSQHNVTPTLIFQHRETVSGASDLRKAA
ncbi:MAG: FkbM family methyltransferase [Planctomycetota bacterium]